MSYFLNPKNLSSVFTVPCSVSDKYLKLATETQLKVLICFLRNMSSDIDTKGIAELLSLPESEVLDALGYWASVGILMNPEQTSASNDKAPKNAVIRAEKPNRTDVAKRGLEDKKIMFMLREAQLKFGRNLKSNESATLVWLYDDMGMDVSVILMAIQYAFSESKGNIRFIEKTAIDWLNNGIETVIDAENEIAKTIQKKSAWGIVQSVFGIDKRQPSTKELEFSDVWINEWGFSRELLKAAYDTCVDTKTKLSMPYINKILEQWHKDKVTSVDGLKEKKTSKKSGKSTTSSVTYDIDLFEEMLNSD